MSLLAPDILEETRALSLGANLIGLLLGLALWGLGWRGYRFWMVLAATVTAGIAGLMLGPVYGTQPAVTGLLLAIAGGMLALSLARMLVFVSGGLLLWLAIRSSIPALSEPWPIPFLTGGLISLLLFRLWAMALTSFAGTLLFWYCGLGLADRLFQVKVVELAQKKPDLLTGIVGAAALAGFLLQFLLDQRRTARGVKTAPSKKKPTAAAPKKPESNSGGEDKKPWLGLVKGLYQKAG